jgi:orotidine-5'-phosphate decarboxylase
VKRARPDFVTAVPGSRLAGDDRNDQRRFGTPDEVARRGGDVIILGRAVTAADDPVRVAQHVYESVQRAITEV